MKKLLKNGHQGVMAQLYSLKFQTSISYMSRDLHKAIKNHPKVFGLMPKGLPPNLDHDHAIHLLPGSVPEIKEEGKITLELETILKTRIK